MKARGHSLWITPKGEVLDVLQDTINELSKKYSAPVFNPHITLLGGLESSEEEIIKKTELITETAAPFKVEFEKIDFQDYYFRCLFLKIKKSDEINSLYKQAKEVFNMEINTVFMPHISLLYGDYPIDIKQKIIEEIKSRFNFEFIAESIDVFRTAGEPNEWIKAKEISFRQKGED